MKGPRLLLLVIFACTVATAGYGQTKAAFEVKVDIDNDSDTCAWVTVYKSRPGLPWEIERAFWLKRHSAPVKVRIVFMNLGLLQLPGEVKVKGEFMQAKDCRGQIMGAPEAERKGLWPADYQMEISANLYGSPYGVSLSY